MSIEMNDNLRRAMHRAPALRQPETNAKCPCGYPYDATIAKPRQCPICNKWLEWHPKRPIPVPASPAKVPLTVPVPPCEAGEPAGQIKSKRRRVMNKTEAAFSLRLMAEEQSGIVQSWSYEGLTLRWGTLDNIQYTPDFAVFRPDKTICLIETKGGHIWPKDIQKFKAARNQWPQFRFEMHQLKKGVWNQLY